MDKTRYTLIERLKNQNNEAAWNTFVHTYESYILAVLLELGINRQDALDLHQDVLLKLWNKLPDSSYQPDQGKFRNWLYQVIKNAAFTYLRSRTSESERIKKYFTVNNQQGVGNERLDSLMDEEWKAYITTHALNELRQHFSVQSIEIFEKSLRGEETSNLAIEYSLKENTIYRIKNRVKDRLIIEVARVRKELE